MAQPVITVSEYVRLLARSKLMPAESVSAMGAAWTGDAADVDGFRKTLTRGGYLTEYQAAMLQRGHYDGFQVGGFIIQERIGHGSTSRVYLGKHPQGHMAAVKVLPASKAQNPKLLARFQREGRLLIQLDHRNVVRAYELGMVKQAHFIAMEHLVGETLEKVLTRRSRLPVPEACRIIVQVFRGLQHLDDHRMVHRDIKPANVMIVGGSIDSTTTATVKLLDIGLGREFFEDGPETPNDPQLTGEGTLLGTPDYLSPEQARDAHSADIRSDIYSTGCILFQLITGRTPFGDTNLMDQVIRHATEHAPRLSQFLPDAPAALQIIMDRLLAKKPANRFASPRLAAKALKAFVEVTPPGSEGATLRLADPPRRG